MIISEELDYDINCALVKLNNKHSERYAIYPWSNENIKNYYNYYDLEGKKVLCPTGSGDHAIKSIEGGASKIDCVDINPLTKYYQALKLAFLSNYNEEKFWQQFKNNSRQILNPKINLEDIKDFLDEDTYVFWSNIINQKAFNNNRNLFRFDGEPTPLKLDYNKAKNNIDNAIITCYDDDIKFFIKDIDEKYDVIFLSNILEWQNERNKQSIIEDCFDILEPNGVIYDAICRRNFNNTTEYNNLEKKIPTKFYDSITVEKGVYVYRKK